MEIVRLHLADVTSEQTNFEAPVHGFVIKHPREGAILVDTGVGHPESLIKHWKIVNRRMADALGEHDLSPADVHIVINTHLHFDHCGQNAVFPHAPFYVQRSELERARQEERVAREWFDFAGARFELVDGDAEIVSGVRVMTTPGHTIGHHSVIVDGEDGEQLFIGDAAYTSLVYERYAEFDPTRVPGQAADPEAWKRSLDRVHEVAPAEVHFCHDRAVLRRG